MILLGDDKLVHSCLQSPCCDLILFNHMHDPTPTTHCIPSVDSIHQRLRYGLEQVVRLQIRLPHGPHGLTHTIHLLRACATDYELNRRFPLGIRSDPALLCRACLSSARGRPQPAPQNTVQIFSRTADWIPYS